MGYADDRIELDQLRAFKASADQTFEELTTENKRLEHEVVKATTQAAWREKRYKVEIRALERAEKAVTITDELWLFSKGLKITTRKDTRGNHTARVMQGKKLLARMMVTAEEAMKGKSAIQRAIHRARFPKEFAAETAMRKRLDAVNARMSREKAEKTAKAAAAAAHREAAVALEAELNGTIAKA